MRPSSTGRIASYSRLCSISSLLLSVPAFILRVGSDNSFVPILLRRKISIALVFGITQYPDGTCNPDHEQHHQGDRQPEPSGNARYQILEKVFLLYLFGRELTTQQDRKSDSAVRLVATLNDVRQ